MEMKIDFFRICCCGESLSLYETICPICTQVPGIHCVSWNSLVSNAAHTQRNTANGQLLCAERRVPKVVSLATEPSDCSTWYFTWGTFCLYVPLANTVQTIHHGHNLFVALLLFKFIHYSLSKQC